MSILHIRRVKACRELEHRTAGKEFGYDCGTQIVDTGAFAQELGTVFASHASR